MKRTSVFCLMLATLLLAGPSGADACSCQWRGPFLAVAPDALLVVRGTVIRHHTGSAPSMDVHVAETLKGGLLDSGLVVYMGNGMLCRPSVEGFPPGSEWILAINGPGAKPGDGMALSHCGEYWLRVENGHVVGSIDGTEKQVKRMPMEEFRNRFLYPRFNQRFSGRVEAGEHFQRPFGARFEFILEPTVAGWEIAVREYGREENLARLTPPLHFAPSPREIEGWHLSANPAGCVSRPYGAPAGPGNSREFLFSPEVGLRIDGPDANRAVTAEDVEAIRRFGRGSLNIEEFSLVPGAEGCPAIEWMVFSVNLEGGY